MEPDLPRGRRFLQAMTAMRAGRNLPEVLREIARGALDLAGGRYAVLGLLDREGEQFTTLVHVGLDEQTAATINPKWSGDDVLTAPVQLQDRTVGYLYVAADEFTPAQRQAIEAMALSAALAVRDYRQLEESRRREAWLQASNEITAALLGGQCDDELGLIAQHAREVAGRRADGCDRVARRRRRTARFQGGARRRAPHRHPGRDRGNRVRARFPDRAARADRPLR
ncbi:hypothetical protein [Kibdelosporangium aridum]|uniref:hypothetical protein n=1 Tax=Kibdelosporangium aridum TaxID=2030 RepID=UPI0035E69BEF